MKKSTISILLSFALVFSSMTVPAFADTIDESIIVEDVVTEDAEEVIVDEEVIDTDEVITDEAASDVEEIVEETTEITEPAEESSEVVGQWKVEVSKNGVSGVEKYRGTLLLNGMDQDLGGLKFVYNKKKGKTIKSKNKLHSVAFVDYGNYYRKLLKKSLYTVSYDAVAKYGEDEVKLSDYADTTKLATKGTLKLKKGLTISKNLIIDVTSYYSIKEGIDAAKNVDTDTVTATIYPGTEPAEDSVKSITLVPTAEGAEKYALKTISDNNATISANMLNYYTVVVTNTDGQIVSGNKLKTIKMTGNKAVGIDSEYETKNVNGSDVEYARKLANTGVVGNAKITVKGIKSKAILKLKTTLPEVAIYAYDQTEGFNGDSIIVTGEDKDPVDSSVSVNAGWLNTTASCNAAGGVKTYFKVIDKATGKTAFKVKFKKKRCKIAKTSNNRYYYVPTAKESTFSIKTTDKEYTVKNKNYLKKGKIKLENKKINVVIPASANSAVLSINSIKVKNMPNGAKYAKVTIDKASQKKAFNKCYKSKYNEDKKRNLYNGYLALRSTMKYAGYSDDTSKTVCISGNEIVFDKVDLSEVYSDDKFDKEAEAIAPLTYNLKNTTPLLPGSYKAYLYVYDKDMDLIDKASITIKCVEK